MMVVANLMATAPPSIFMMPGMVPFKTPLMGAIASDGRVGPLQRCLRSIPSLASGVQILRRSLFQTERLPPNGYADLQHRIQRTIQRWTGTSSNSNFAQPNDPPSSLC